MNVTIGGVSVGIAEASADGRPSVGLDLGADSPVSRFAGQRQDRPAIDLTVTWVAETSWDGILTPRDFARTRRIAGTLRKRFPFTRVAWEGAVGLTAPAKAGNLSLPLLAEFEDADVSVVPHPGFILTVDHRAGRAEALVKAPPGIETPLTTVLQAVLALLAPDHGALMLHAASLALGGGGYLFIGNSGAGKSTIAGAAKPGLVLSDDGSWCGRGDSGFFLFPTPFSQIDPGPGSVNPVALARVLFIRQGADNRIAALSPSRAMTALLLNQIHFFRFMGRRPAEKAFALAGEICTRYPVATLVFNRGFNPESFFRGVTDERKKAV